MTHAAKPGDSEVAARIKPVRAHEGALSWLRSRAVWGALLASAIVVAGVVRWGSRQDWAARATPAPMAPVRLETALAAAQERLKGNPQDIATLIELGTLEYQKGREAFPDAINALEEARDLGALDSRIFYHLGVMYQELGLYPFAIEEYRRYLRNHPDDEETRLLLAKLLHRQGSYAEAVVEYERLKFHHPADDLIDENLGLSLLGAKQVDRAVEVFSALKSRGAEPGKRADFYLGQIAFDRGDYPKAVEHILLSVARGGALEAVASEKIYAQLGMAYQKLGSAAEAREAWRKVLSFAPGDSKALASLKELDRRFPPNKKKKAARR